MYTYSTAEPTAIDTLEHLTVYSIYTDSDVAIQAALDTLKTKLLKEVKDFKATDYYKSLQQ